MNTAAASNITTAGAAKTTITTATALVLLLLAGCSSLHDERYSWCQAQDCRPAPVVTQAPKPVPPPPARPAPRRVTLSADALFAFDRSGPADILPRGRIELDRLAQQLRAEGVEVQSLVITGHADRLGSAAYNEQLALHRAATVRDHLQGAGLAMPMQVRSMGEREPVTTSCKGNARSPALVACLQPDRRVVVDILGQAPGQ